MLLHYFAGPLNDAADARLADEHVVGLLGEHKAAGSRKRIKTRFRERAKLKLAVPVGKEREHIKSEPIRSRLIKRTENTRVISISGAPGEQGFSFLAAIASEIAMQQVHHGPQVAPLFHVDLENVPQVVHRRTGSTQHSLLLHGSRLRISLRDNDAAQGGTVFPGHFLPRGLAFVGAEISLALLVARLEKNSPAVVWHLHVVKLRPAVGFHTDGSPQINFIVVALIWPHVVPPTHVGGL